MDASVLFEVLVGEHDVDEHPEWLLRVGEVHVPSLARYEVAQVLRGGVLRGLLREDAAAVALDSLVRLSLVEWSFAPFADRIWQLRANLTASDAAYVALAEHLHAPLVTKDQRSTTAPGLRCEILVSS